MNGYLPQWASVEQACNWLKERTGEEWPLERLIDEGGLRPSVWLEAPEDASTEVLNQVYGGRAEGFIAEFVFQGDFQRAAFERKSLVLSMTASPSRQFVRFNPPIPVSHGDLRFRADEVKALADCLLRPEEAEQMRQPESAEAVDTSAAPDWRAEAEAEGKRWQKQRRKESSGAVDPGHKDIATHLHGWCKTRGIRSVMNNNTPSVEYLRTSIVNGRYRKKHEK